MGGNSPNCGGVGQAAASIFELSPAGGTAWTQTTIYTFQDHADGPSLSQGLPLTLPATSTAQLRSYTEGRNEPRRFSLRTFSRIRELLDVYAPLHVFFSTRLTKPRKLFHRARRYNRRSRKSVWRNVLRRSLFQRLRSLSCPRQEKFGRRQFCTALADQATARCLRATGHRLRRQTSTAQLPPADPRAGELPSNCPA